MCVRQSLCMTFNAGGGLSRGGKGREMNWHVDWNVRQSELKLSRKFRDRKRRENVFGTKIYVSGLYWTTEYAIERLYVIRYFESKLQNCS